MIIDPIGINNPLHRWVKDRIEANRNVLSLCVGSTGSGKSYANLWLAVCLAKIFGTSFNVDENVAFSFKELLNKMKNPKFDGLPGCVFVFEEVGSIASGAASRNWQSKANSFFHSYLQTSRHRNQIVLMSCPMLTNLEAGSRNLLHLLIQMSHVNPQKKMSFAKVFYNQTNSKTGKTYFKFLRYSFLGGKFKYKQHGFKLCMPEILVPYERDKLAYTTALNKSFFAKTDPKEVKAKKTKDFLRKLKKYAGKGLSTYDISKLTGVCQSTIMNYIKKEGIKQESDDI